MTGSVSNKPRLLINTGVHHSSGISLASDADDQKIVIMTRVNSGEGGGGGAIATPSSCPGERASAGTAHHWMKTNQNLVFTPGSSQFCADSGSDGQN